MKVRAGIVGATGIVGQYMSYLLSRNPWFEIVFLSASEEKAGHKYGEIVKWYAEFPFPEELEDMELIATDPIEVMSYRPQVIFSALPSDISEKIEKSIAELGGVVVSNSSTMRLEPDIPLLNPEVNAEHLSLIKYQRERRRWRGFIVKVPNCTTAILTLTLKPILDHYGMSSVTVTSMQSISGAGLHGVSALSIIDNIIPYIRNEEEKIERETKKILGSIDREGVRTNDEIEVTATATRVSVLYGHLVVVNVNLKKEADETGLADVLGRFDSNMIKNLSLPTAPERPIEVVWDPREPQPRRNRLKGTGMTVTVGRIKVKDGAKRARYLAFGHNLIRGAAGTAVLIAELLARKGLI